MHNVYLRVFCKIAITEIILIMLSASFHLAYGAEDERQDWKYIDRVYFSDTFAVITDTYWESQADRTKRSAVNIVLTESESQYCIVSRSGFLHYVALPYPLDFTGIPHSIDSSLGRLIVYRPRPVGVNMSDPHDEDLTIYQYSMATDSFVPKFDILPLLSERIDTSKYSYGYSIQSLQIPTDEQQLGVCFVNLRYSTEHHQSHITSEVILFELVDNKCPIAVDIFTLNPEHGISNIYLTSDYIVAIPTVYSQDFRNKYILVIPYTCDGLIELSNLCFTNPSQYVEDELSDSGFASIPYIGNWLGLNNQYLYTFNEDEMSILEIDISNGEERRSISWDSVVSQ